MQWAYGITTVPKRCFTLLPQTIASLAKAGFDLPVLFVDGMDPGWTPPVSQLGGVMFYQPPVGHLANWMLGLLHLFTTQPTADYYAIFEDDLAASKNLRQYLESCTYPDRGYWNLLTHPQNLALTGGIDGWHLSNQRGKGAVGLVFNRATAKDLLSSPIFLDRPKLTTRGPAADGMVMDSMSALNYKEYIHCPTLVQHMGGGQSTMDHPYGTMIGWRGEDYDLMQITNGAKSSGSLGLESLPTGSVTMTETECLRRMVPPSQIRPSVWRGGVLQIHVTRACDQACTNCTQGSQLRGKPAIMSLAEFETACKSLKGYWGVVGIFGGNPALHPAFEELCEIFCDHFPLEQRGLWCNHPRGHGAIMRRTFNPSISNLNVHLSQEAYNEFKRDWPESNPFGLTNDSRHSPPWVAMIDLPKLPWPDGSERENTEENRLELISRCDINQRWSAMICSVPGRGLRAYFCEIAGAQAILHAHDPNWPDTGVSVVEGWWTKPMAEFAHQVKQHCHRCGCPLKLLGQLAVHGEYEETTQTHIGIYRPKKPDRPVKLLSDLPKGRLPAVTDYLQNANLEVACND